MADEKTMSIRTEGAPAFPTDTGTDNPADSSPENTNTDQTPSQEGEQTPAKDKDGGAEDKGDKGFADDPRWQEREKDWKERYNEQETRHTDEIGKLREEFGEKIDAQKPVDPALPPIPGWFGGDAEAWAEYQRDFNTQLAQSREEGKKSVMDEITNRSDADQKAVDDATAYLNDEIREIEADRTLNPTGEKVDRNKLVKFVMDRNLIDPQQRWNWRAGYEWMKATKGTKEVSGDTNLQDKKELAGATTDGGRGGEQTTQKATTSEDFKKPGARPW